MHFIFNCQVSCRNVHFLPIVLIVINIPFTHGSTAWGSTLLYCYGLLQVASRLCVYNMTMPPMLNWWQEPTPRRSRPPRWLIKLNTVFSSTSYANCAIKFTVFSFVSNFVTIFLILFSIVDLLFTRNNFLDRPTTRWNTRQIY